MVTDDTKLSCSFACPDVRLRQQRGANASLRNRIILIIVPDHTFHIVIANVPFNAITFRIDFILRGRMLIPGAQDVEVFTRVIETKVLTAAG